VVLGLVSEPGGGCLLASAAIGQLLEASFISYEYAYGTRNDPGRKEL